MLTSMHAANQAQLRVTDDYSVINFTDSGFNEVKLFLPAHMAEKAKMMVDIFNDGMQGVRDGD